MLKITNIKKTYKTSNLTQVALDGVSINFRENEFVAILGPSGSGKTTLLNIIGGLDHYDSGDLLIDGKTTKEYKDRDWDTYRNNRIGFVFQSYNLIPHQSVLSNVELALTLSGVSKEERRQRAIDALAEVGLKEHIHKKPNQLSGGQMQRVAIARALVNNPSILLADEPTGALDSKTSVQVMDLLTQIAKDRLVIMVTHNNELAEDYATRTVTLRDGKIIGDTDPFDEEKSEMKPTKVRKASMSFLTALSLSFSNLMTKKGRTFVTAIAGSIGIIGIALILALANGINDYIGDVQRETLSIYPLSIQETGTSMGESNNTTSKTDSSDKNKSKSEDGKVQEASSLGRMFKSQSNNDLKALKKYVEENQGKISKNVNSIEYKYNITPQIYLGDTSKGVNKVNPDPLFASNSYSGSSMITSMMSTVGISTSMTAFQELPGELKLYEDQYSVSSGRWPTNYDEAVLVLGHNGKVSDFSLYELGLKDRSDLETIMEGINSGKSDGEVDVSNSSVSYDDIMNANLKVVNAADQYEFNSSTNTWIDKSNSKSFMKPLVKNGISLKIVGIVKPKSDDGVVSLSSGIYYTPDLVIHLMRQAKESGVVKAQLANKKKNVLTNNTFASDNKEKGNFDFSKIITIDKDKLQNAFKFDASNIKIDFSGLDLSKGMTVEPPEIDVDALTKTLSENLNIPTADITRIITATMVDFMQEEIKNGVTDSTKLEDDLTAYLNRPDVQAGVQSQFAAIIGNSSMGPQINEALQEFLDDTMNAYVTQMTTSIQNTISSYIGKVTRQMQSQLPNAFTVDQSAIASAFKLTMSEDEIMALMSTMMNPQKVSYDGNLNSFGYGEEDTPSAINFYPLSFDDKSAITGFIEDYNDKMDAAGDEDKVIHYSDLVGTMMSSVTDIVDMVSYALIAFVAISLVVSSIMIGVITYISVLERKKEIGILRAMGASKRNIKQVFNAETIIIGLLAGGIGVITAAIVSVVASIVVANKFNVENIMQLPVIAAVVLVGISVFLTFIAGLFPAASAASKDPVEALRSE